MMRRIPLLLLVVLAGALALGPLAHAAPPDHAAGRAKGDPPGLREAGPADPEYSVAPELLADAVDCIGFDGATSDIVVLVHGTGTEGHEQYAWNYELRLADEAIPYCVVTYPDRGQGDMQVSAEYVAHAVQHAAGLSPTGRVDMVGHSQGASMPRWAVKYWPSVQAVLDDFVMHAGPNHGTIVADDPTPGLLERFGPLGQLGARPAVYHQFRTDSMFNDHVNRGDETPGEVDYTSIYAYTDELVQPSGPNGPATAALEVDRPDKVVNVNVQDLCPGRLLDHLSIGTTDRFVMDLTIRTLLTDGPADVSAVDPASCIVADQYVTPATLTALFRDTGGGPGSDDLRYLFDPDNYVTEEPPIRQYALDRDAGAD